jgi:hypothetical protein
MLEISHLKYSMPKPAVKTTCQPGKTYRRQSDPGNAGGLHGANNKMKFAVYFLQGAQTYSVRFAIAQYALTENRRCAREHGRRSLR